jgi:hypothetical protein
MPTTSCELAGVQGRATYMEEGGEGEKYSYLVAKLPLKKVWNPSAYARLMLLVSETKHDELGCGEGRKKTSATDHDHAENQPPFRNSTLNPLIPFWPTTRSIFGHLSLE